MKKEELFHLSKCMLILCCLEFFTKWENNTHTKTTKSSGKEPPKIYENLYYDPVIKKIVTFLKKVSKDTKMSNSPNVSWTNLGNVLSERSHHSQTNVASPYLYDGADW